MSTCNLKGLSFSFYFFFQSPGASMVVGGVIPDLEITFVMPSQSPGKESSGGDIESVIPDSSSLQEDGTLRWQSTGSAGNVNINILVLERKG